MHAFVSTNSSADEDKNWCNLISLGCTFKRDIFGAPDFFVFLINESYLKQLQHSSSSGGGGSSVCVSTDFCCFFQQQPMANCLKRRPSVRRERSSVYQAATSVLHQPVI